METSSEAVNNGAETTDNADVIPDPPENVDLKIISQGQSDYVIVYDADIKEFEAAAHSLSNYINDQFGVSLTVYSDENAPSDSKRIVIGDADINAVHVKNKLNEYNDFAVEVCGDDLVLYAANEYLYDYLFEIAREKFFTKAGDDSELLIAKDGGFIYHQSEYKKINYAQYIRNKNGSIDRNGLLELFDAEEYTARDGTALPYRIYIPSNYDPKNQTTPLIVFLHGAGERGTDNQRQFKQFLPEAFSQSMSPYAEAIIIAPQCPSDQQWVDTPWADGNYSVDQIAESNELGAVVELISEVENKYKPDADRYYAIGLSMGGFATWDLIMRHTELFAAAMPICGGADPTKAEKLKELPIWTFHGTEDKTVPYAGTKAMCDAIKLTGSEVFEFTSMTNYDHGIWSNIGSNTRYGKWLLKQVRSAN